MRFLEEWSSVRHFLSIEYSNSFGDTEKTQGLTEKTQGLVGGIPSRCPPAFPSSRRSILIEAYVAGGRFRIILDLFLVKIRHSDGLLRVLPECGGRTSNEQGFVRGAPELIIEVSKATRYVDLGPKLADYEQAGVLEYLVRALDPDEVFLFQQEQGTLIERPLDADGLYRLTSFPGLWLDPQALLAGDTRRLRAMVDLGLATTEHAEFVARLAEGPAAGS